MALNTPVAIQQVGNTTTELAAKTGVARQIVVDTTKNTLVVLDGSTAGGHPLAKESLKISSGSPNLKINGGAEATLSGDIVITMLPGYVPTGFAFVENPAGQTAGKYLEIKYTDQDGTAKSYFVDAAILVDTYTAGDGVAISGTNVVSLNLGVGLLFDEGKVKVDWSAVDLSGFDWMQVIDSDSNLTVKDGKLSTKASLVVSADSGNILKAGSDGGAFMPGDLGSL